jgi:hypothetical protein
VRRFTGFDTRLDRPVALKVKRAALTDPPHGVSPFLREARTASSGYARLAKPTS